MLRRDHLTELGIDMIINYNRRSRQDEELERRTGEDTLQAQIDLMNRILEPLEIPFDQENEIGSGDKISTRPVFQRVIVDLKKGKYQAIAVKEISRMGRGSYTDMGVIYDLIEENCIFIVTPYKVYDPRNQADLRQIRFELFMSREEFETTKERLNGGKNNAALNGHWISGQPPYGYIYNNKTRKLEIDEEEAKVVRLIFDLYVNGLSLPGGKKKEMAAGAISTYLTRKTLYPSPFGKDEWSQYTVRRFLTNDRYIGIMRYRTTKRIGNKQVRRPEEEHIVNEHAIPAIIDMDMWEKAQEKFERNAGAPRNKMDFSPCELAGLCVCVVCGKKMMRQYSVQKYKKADGTVSTYEKEFLWCKTIGCTFVKYRNIEADMLQVLKLITERDDEFLLTYLNQIIEKETGSTNSVQLSIEQLNSKKQELKRREKFIYERYEDGKYDDEVFEERIADVREALKKVDELFESLDENHESDSVDINEVENARKNAKALYDMYMVEEDKTEKNNILRSVFDRVYIEITEPGRGKIQAKHVIYPLLKPVIINDGHLV